MEPLLGQMECRCGADPGGRPGDDDESAVLALAHGAPAGGSTCIARSIVDSLIDSTSSAFG
jgi:hypothetical protein